MFRSNRSSGAGRSRTGDCAVAAHLCTSRSGTNCNLRGSAAMKIFVFGSSIVSSYWNGAATYYRGIYKYLARRGHEITFAEPDAYGRQEHRDAGDFSYVNSIVYRPTDDVELMLAVARKHDLMIKHSGIGVDDEVLETRVAEAACEMPAFFWDVDSPATLARVGANAADPFREDIPRYTGI